MNAFCAPNLMRRRAVPAVRADELVRAPVTRPGAAAWTEVIGPSPGTRLVRCDVFGRYLVVEQRRGARTQLRVVDRETGTQRLIEAGGPEQALALAVNEEYAASG